MYSTVDVATIITLTLIANGSPLIVSESLALEVMHEIACVERLEAIKAIYKHTGAGSLKACMYAVKAVNAYMGKTW